MEPEKFSYDNKIVKAFIIATVIFGLVGMLVGLTAAIQLVYPIFNFDLQYTTFGRIRPLHTNAIIFAFVGNAMFAGVYYSLQRLTKSADAQRYVKLDSLLGLAAHHCGSGHYAAVGYDYLQGICGARMAHRHCHYRDLGSIRLEHDRHYNQAA